MAVFGGVDIYFVEGACLAPSAELLILSAAVLQGSITGHFSQRGRLFLHRCFDQGQLFLHVCTNLKDKIQNIPR